MLIPTVIMGLIAAALLLVGYRQGLHAKGVTLAGQMIVQMLPILIFALIIAGMIQVLISKETLSVWIGEQSGIRGIFLGTVAGTLSPGGPFMCLPLAAGFIRAGAGAGTVVAYLTGWSLLSLARLPMEIGILGWRITVIRVLSVLIFPPIAGLLAQSISGWFK